MKKIIITGHVGKDPVLQTNQFGQTFATFTFAISNPGGNKDKAADWVDVMCNGKMVDVAMEHIKKGNKLLIEGTPSVHAYISKDGRAVGVQRVYLNIFEFAGGNNAPDNQQFVSSSNASSNEHSYSDIPF